MADETNDGVHLVILLILIGLVFLLATLVAWIF